MDRTEQMTLVSRGIQLQVCKICSHHRYDITQVDEMSRIGIPHSVRFRDTTQERAYSLYPTTPMNSRNAMMLPDGERIVIVKGCNNLNSFMSEIEDGMIAMLR